MNYKNTYDEFKKASAMVSSGEIKFKDRNISPDVGGILSRRRPKSRPTKASPLETIFSYFNEMQKEPEESMKAPEARPWEASVGEGGEVTNWSGTPEERRIAWRNSIADIESRGSGGYKAVGATHKTMGRALGRYQIMEANLPQWSKDALGRSVTAEEFMANEKIQDAIFDHRFGKYVEKHGEENAARAWFGGEGGISKPNRTDVHGKKTIGSYGETFVSNLVKRRP